MSAKNSEEAKDLVYFVDGEGNSFKQDPIVILPDGGDNLEIAGGKFIHKVSSMDTNNVFSVIEIITPPGKGVALHVHEKEDELVYLLQGEIEVTPGDQTMRAVPRRHAPYRKTGTGRRSRD